MFLSDYHIHSTVSPDGHNTMAEMALASASSGVSQLCFTDHCDMVNWFDSSITDACFGVVPRALEQYREAVELCGRDIDIRLGIELGEAQHAPEQAAAVAEAPELDFILGSLHIMKNAGDFCFIKYRSEAHCYELLEQYMDELQFIADLNVLDVMAHIGYTQRDMSKNGYPIALTMDRFGDQIDRLFRTLIQNGRGIEVNCSGLRDGFTGATFPNIPLLKRYRELGGEIITVGSDAHRAEDAGTFLREGFEILHSAGFKYVCSFKKHKPEFIKI